jgi:murein DD-endopeptidase MepM/ murein hydrolase activator NlpD
MDCGGWVDRRTRIITYVGLGIILAGVSFAWRTAKERESSAAIHIVAEQNATAQLAYENRDQQLESVVRNGATWSDLLQEMDFDSQTVFNVTEAARRVYNLRSIRPGNKFSVVRSHAGELVLASYHIDPEHELLVNRDGPAFHAEIKNTPGTIRTVAVNGTVQGSLFDSVIAAGERPELAVRLAEIFAWDMDFNSDTQPGDVFRLVVEKKDYSDHSSTTYGRILLAEYTNAGHPYRAVLFRDSEGRPAYYSADGKSLQKAFLRSPLRFAARVSSHFSLHRYHPILKITRPHLGTDYAAPVGTPVQTIADGRVVFAGRKGGDGNMVKIAHSRGYETYYLHLSQILVRNSQNVHQGQRIGLVGATGLATGPHLDFRIQQHGQFVNFERLKLPPANPVDKRDWAEFASARDKWIGMMPGNVGHAVEQKIPGHQPGRGRL